MGGFAKTAKSRIARSCILVTKIKGENMAKRNTPNGAPKAPSDPALFTSSRAGAMTLEQLDRLASLLNNANLNATQRSQIENLLESNIENLLKETQQQESNRIASLKQRALAAKELEENRVNHQARCSHRKYNAATNQSETFLMGQWLQDGTLMLMCQNSVCQKVFSIPERKDLGWETPPLSLIPKRGIGGVIDMYGSIKAAQEAARRTVEQLEQEKEANVA
jgi:hypothetical protein